ncbi:OsmC family protein [Streptosporangium minutum]|uniref:OsmC family protein n=1 Tax=Streptosporangium minutum TaxID=569862 RepID=UPI0024184B67|nr:OsmC family protein [Streptosporangium minutum]
MRQPEELGGDGEGTNPEQLFAIGYAACFAASLALVGQRKQLRADDAAIDAKVMLIPVPPSTPQT